MRLTRRGLCLLAVLFWFVALAAIAHARDFNAPWTPLPPDAKLISDPAALTALFADHTVRAIYLPDGTKWREFSAADGRTVWEFNGCLHPGTWRVSGSTICYRYPSWDDGRPQCFMVYRSAQLTHFVWLDPQTGSQWLVSNATELDPGNPDHLPLDGVPGCGAPAV